MHFVTPDSITLVADDPRPGYRFRVSAVPTDVRMVDIAREAQEAIGSISDPRGRHRAYPAERERDAVLAAFADRSGPAAVLGVSTATAVAAARTAYANLGYYRPESNRLHVPDDATCRLGVYAEHLLYSLKDARRYPEASSLAPPLRDPGDSLALSRALNYGAVSWIILPDDDDAAVRLAGELVTREIVPLVSLAGVLARHGRNSVIDVLI